MRFLDSNILAYAFYNNEHILKCQKAIIDGGITDTFNLVEAFFILEKETGSRESAQKSIRGLLKSNLAIIEVDVNLIFESLRRINRTRLSIFDSVHYNCALINGCTAILSYDKDFDNMEIPRIEP